MGFFGQGLRMTKGNTFLITLFSQKLLFNCNVLSILHFHYTLYSILCQALFFTLKSETFIHFNLQHPYYTLLFFSCQGILIFRSHSEVATE